MALGEFHATQTTTASYADVLRTDGVAYMDTAGCMGSGSYILKTGNATGGCDFLVFATNDNPAITPDASCTWAQVVSGTAPASANTVIFGSSSDGSDTMRHAAYKVQVRYHSGGGAQAVTLIGLAKA